MKILNYTNKFQVILDIIFKPNKFLEQLCLYKKEAIGRVVRESTEKLDMIQYDQYKNGIVIGDISKNQIAISKIPKRGIDFPIEDEDDPSIVRASIEYKEIYPINFSYMGDTISPEEIKQHLALELAKHLVNKGFIQSKVGTNDIVFYINAFGK